MAYKIFPFCLIYPKCLNPPWITKPLKSMLNRKNRLYKSYRRHGYTDEDKVRLDNFRIECQQAVENAKLSYITNLGNKVNDPNTSQKTYWKIINNVMNKCRPPKIPPLLVNNLIILMSRVKARYFNDFFSKQCTPIINNRCYLLLAFLLIRGLIINCRKHGNYFIGVEYKPQ